MAGGEAVEPEGRVERMRLVARDRVGEAPARGRRRLEAAVAPARVEIEALDRRPVDDRRAVHRHVHQAAPAPQQPQPPDHRHQRHAALAHVLDRRQVAALGVGVVAVDVAAEHQPALVGLADVEVAGAEGDDVVDQRLDALRHEGLQHVALDRQPQPRERRHARGVAGAGEPDLAGAHEALARIDADDAPALDADARHLAVLHDVDAALARRPAHSPRPPHRAAPCRRAAAAARPGSGSARCRNRDRAASP